VTITAADATGKQIQFKIDIITDCEDTTVDMNKTNLPKEASFTFNHLAPQPASTYLEVSIDYSETAPLNILVYSLRGQQMLTQRIDTKAGSNRFRIDTESLPKGLYILQINDGKSMITKKFVKE